MSDVLSSDKELHRKVSDLGRQLEALKAILGDFHADKIAALEATAETLVDEIQSAQAQLEEAQETIHAIRTGTVDALVVQGPQGEQVYTLKDAAEPYRVMVEAMAEGAVTFSPDGTILYCNARFAELLKVSLDQVIGSTLQNFVAPQERPAFEALMAESCNRPIHSKISLQAADDRSLPTYFSTRAIKEKNLNAIAAVVTDLSDIVAAQSELSRLNAELEERVLKRTAELTAANKELEAFAYSVSHDLRAPLRSIDGFSLALLEEYADKLDAEGKDYLQRVRAASQRMGQLIDDILNLSHVTRIEMAHAPVDLSALARRIAAGLQKEQPEREVEFVIQDGMIVAGDERLLQVLLENLIGNAWKYTSKHASARIEFGQTEASGKNVYFVRDNGAGFDMAYAEKLFYPFQRLHSTEEFSGSGIGLAIVQRIIHRHGGAVWGEGAVEQGATFYFRLD